MTKKLCFSLALSLLLGAASAQAQTAIGGMTFRGQGFRPAFPHNQFFGARPVFPRQLNPFFPNQFGPFPPSNFLFPSFGFGPTVPSRFFFRHRVGSGFFNGSFGYPFYGFGAYSYPFVSPFGAGPYSGGGEASSRGARPAPTEKSSSTPQQAKGEPQPPSSDAPNPDAVRVTLDGQEQPSSRPLQIGSGQHTIQISARPGS